MVKYLLTLTMVATAFVILLVSLYSTFPHQNYLPNAHVNPYVVLNPTVTPKPSLTPTSIPVISIPINKIPASWVTYKNNNLKIQINYPPKYKITTSKKDQIEIVSPDYQEKYINEEMGSDTISGFKFSIDINPYKCGEPPPSGSVGITTQKTTINSLSAVVYWFSNESIEKIRNVDFFVNQNCLATRPSYGRNHDSDWNIIFSQMINSIKLITLPTSVPKSIMYTCPTQSWVDCMPSPNTPSKTQCQPEFLQWAKTNCPGFQGAAL